MNRLISSLITITVLAMPTASAQQPETAGAARLSQIVSTPRSEWLGSFDGITVTGNMHVRLIKNSAEEGPRIIYDTKGVTAGKFTAAVDKKGVLKIDEPIDDKRTTITEVTIYCNEISSLSVAGADFSFENTVTGKMFDLEVSSGATVTAKVDVSDLAAEITGKSCVVIEGAARYMKLNISTAKFDGAELTTMSSIIDASHGADVKLSVTERLEAVTSTSGKISYKGNPEIVRVRSSLFGGEIIAVEN